MHPAGYCLFEWPGAGQGSLFTVFHCSQDKVPGTLPDFPNFGKGFEQGGIANTVVLLLQCPGIAVKEINDIIQAFETAEKSARQTALVTVVHVDGSSYRRPGARMLVTDEGQLTGAISGGCLEGDALRKALHVMNQQKPMLVTYDTMDEDDARLGIGLGCNGIIQVLIEPIDTANQHNPIALLKKITGKRQQAVLATLFSLRNRNEEQPGTCLLLTENTIISSLNKPFFLLALLQDVQKAMTENNTSFKNYVSGTQDMNALVEFIRPPVSLVVAGAGNDSLPLLTMAAMMGWETTVVDGRPGYARPGRFAANCQVLLSPPGKVLERIRIDEQTVFVLMTHNYNYDLELLKSLLQKDIAYIGSLGPKKKLDRMLDDMQSAGISISPAQRAAVYGPAGLDIGAESPEEIALSILAEIQAVLAGRNGHPLRDHMASIHPRAAFVEKIIIQKQEETQTR